MKKLILIISIFYTILGNTTFAETGTIIESKSINEIKKDIEKGHIDRNNLKNQLTILTENNNFVLYLVKNGFFRENINRDELTNIELLIKDYNKKYSDTDILLLDKIKNLEEFSDEKEILLKELLNLKKELYQELIPYIKQIKFKEYLDFIRNDANILKKNNEVKYSLIQNKEVLTTKVSKLEEKIQEQRNLMSEHLRVKVGNQIDKKIESIKNNPQFITLSRELQFEVITKTIGRVNDEIIKTKDLQNKDNILEQKIEIYELLVDKLTEYQNTLDIKKEGE